MGLVQLRTFTRSYKFDKENIQNEILLAHQETPILYRLHFLKIKSLLCLILKSQIKS